MLLLLPSYGKMRAKGGGLVYTKKDIRIKGHDYRGGYEEPSLCPICKHAIKPQELSFSSFNDEKDHWFLSVTYLCKHCYQTFVVLHDCNLRSTKNANGISSLFYETKMIYTEPNRFKQMEFDAKINALSQQFVKIYNQALAAESSGLDEIAGIGYRKALEFLIKDFLIHENPDDAETIKKMELGNCIANKVSNEKLKIVASRSVWLGNDQTHYVQRFKDKDISDMKNFIKASVYWISMELITEEALSIKKQGQP